MKIVPASEAPQAPTGEAPEAKSRPDAKTTGEAPAKAAPKKRRNLRMMLLVVLPLIAAVGGGAFYLMGGRYISTDNAYVGAQKVLITADVSGKIIHIAVREGQHVKPGDELFKLDPEPYQLALDQAESKLVARAHRIRQAEDHAEVAHDADRPRAQERRAQEAGRRAQADAARFAGRLAAPTSTPRRSAW